MNLHIYMELHECVWIMDLYDTCKQNRATCPNTDIVRPVSQAALRN